VEATRLLTRAEVAEIFAVTPSTIRRWQLAGILPAATVTHQTVRYRPEDVEALIEAHGPARDGAGQQASTGGRSGPG
jgi:predicted site-specific integrase-resolvase